MAIGVCRECGNKVSSEADVCPRCGAPCPYREKRTAVVVWIGAVFLGLSILAMCAPQNGRPVQPTASDLPPQSPRPKTGAEIEAENRAAVRSLPSQQLRPVLADRLLLACQRAAPHLNYVKTSVRGNAILCVHSFYSEHSLQIGPLAGEIERFIGDWGGELRRAGIKRVGVWGTGEFATGSYCDLN